MNSPQLLLSWVRSCPFSPNNGFLYFLPSCLSTPLRFTSASSVVLLRLRHSVTSAPSAWPLHIRALVFVIGERTHVSPFVFPRGLGWGRSLAALGCISWVFHCTQPTAFPLTSPWTGPNVYEPWPVVAPPPPPPHPHYTFLHTYGAPLLPNMTSTSVLFMTDCGPALGVTHCVGDVECIIRIRWRCRGGFCFCASAMSPMNAWISSSIFHCLKKKILCTLIAL